jgi:replicative DNA helicase
VNTPSRRDDMQVLLLPHNIEAEQALLGAILINDKRVVASSSQSISSRRFIPKVYNVARALVGAGKVATPVTIKSFLPADLDIAGVTLGQYLGRLAAEATTIINAVDYRASASTCRHVGRSFQRQIARTLIGRNEDGQNE